MFLLQIQQRSDETTGTMRCEIVPHSTKEILGYDHIKATQQNTHAKTCRRGQACPASSRQKRKAT